MNITIVTPVYNRADCLESTLQSVASQVLPDGIGIEHIVVDDGSTDGTRAIIERYCAENSYAKSIFFPSNRGTNAARNAAIAAATGEYVTFLDSDDAYVPGALSTAFDFIKSHPGYRHYMFNRDTCMSRESFGKEYVFEYRDFLEGRIDGDFAHFIVRETIQRYPFDEGLRIHEGVIFLFFYREAGKILYSSAELQMIDRRRSDRVTRTTFNTNDKALRTGADALELRHHYFSEDYLRYPKARTLYAALMSRLYRYRMMLGEYREADDVESRVALAGGTVPMPDRLIRRIHMGRLFCQAVYKPLCRLKHILEN